MKELEQLELFPETNVDKETDMTQDQDTNDNKIIALTVGELNLILQNALYDAYGFLTAENPDVWNALQLRYKLEINEDHNE